MYYDCKFINCYCIVEIDEGHWLLDTSRPKSISIDRNELVIEIKDSSKRFRVDSTNENELYKLYEINNFEFNGIIGADILSQTSFTIFRDYRDQHIAKIIFNSDNIDERASKVDVKMRKHNAKYVISGELVIDEKKVKVFFNTGFNKSFINLELVKSIYSTRESTYIDKEGNSIPYKFYIRSVKYGEHYEKGAYWATDDPNSDPYKIMSETKCDAIIGLFNYDFDAPIFEEYISFDYKNKKIYIK